MLNTNIDIKSINNRYKKIVSNIINKKRISENEAILLLDNAPLSLLGSLANSIRQEKNKNYTYFNKNIHIEPTNICVFDCKFCSYSRLLKKRNEGWEYSIEQMLDKIS